MEATPLVKSSNRTPGLGGCAGAASVISRFGLLSDHCVKRKPGLRYSPAPSPLSPEFKPNAGVGGCADTTVLINFSSLWHLDASPLSQLFKSNAGLRGLSASEASGTPTPASLVSCSNRTPGFWGSQPPKPLPTAASLVSCSSRTPGLGAVSLRGLWHHDDSLLSQLFKSGARLRGVSDSEAPPDGSLLSPLFKSNAGLRGLSASEASGTRRQPS